MDLGEQQETHEYIYWPESIPEEAPATVPEETPAEEPAPASN